MANCNVDVYLTLAAFIAAVEALDDTKYLDAFVYQEPGTTLEKIILVSKT